MENVVTEQEEKEEKATISAKLSGDLDQVMSCRLVKFRPDDISFLHNLICFT